MAVNVTELVTQSALQLNTSLAVSAGDHSSIPALDVFAVVLMSVIIVVAVHGNIFIIVVIFINPQLRSSLANIFIVNLCTVDLLASVVASPLSVITFLHGHDALKREVCEVSGFLNTFVMVASMLSLCIISVERFYSIALPMHHAGHATPCMYVLAVLLVWTLSAVLAILPLLGINSYSFRPPKRICSFNWLGGSSHEQIFVIFIFTASFLLPSLILITMYVGIFQVARKAASTVRPHPCRTATMETDLEVGAPAADPVATQNGCIFSISKPDKVSSNLPAINVQNIVSCNNSENSITKNLSDYPFSTTDSCVRTAEVVNHCTSTHLLSPINNNAIKIDKDCNQKSVESEEQQQQQRRKKTCSKFLCICNKAGTSRPVSSILTSVCDHAPAESPAETRDLRTNCISDPKSTQVHPDTGKVKATHMKAFKTLMIIVVSYFILWSPYFVCLLYDLTHKKAAPAAMELLFTWISFASYAANPCLYGLMNRIIREELSQLLKCVFSCCCCCELGHGGRGCRRPCQKVADDSDIDDGDDEVCLGGGESFYQFLQRTQASDATSPCIKGTGTGQQTYAEKIAGTDTKGDKRVPDNQSNCVF